MEFGEKLKQVREEKGMTQQKIAEKLYVTRQAVSRWECGARYPDLLTTKKIAQILNVPIDELLSGEELKLNVESQPVLAKPIENTIQTVLYTISAVALLLISIFGIYSLFPSETLAKTPAGTTDLMIILRVCGYIINLLVVLIGLKLSIQNKLTAKITGYIMCLPYVNVSSSFLLTYIDMKIKRNGHIGVGSWITNFFIPLIFAICVLLFFILEEQRLPYGVILLICIISSVKIILINRHAFIGITDLGFVVTTVHCLREIVMIFLLTFQAYIWNQKRRKAIKI